MTGTDGKRESENSTLFVLIGDDDDDVCLLIRFFCSITYRPAWVI